MIEVNVSTRKGIIPQGTSMLRWPAGVGIAHLAGELMRRAAPCAPMECEPRGLLWSGCVCCQRSRVRMARSTILGIGNPLTRTDGRCRTTHCGRGVGPARVAGPHVEDSYAVARAIKIGWCASSRCSHHWRLPHCAKRSLVHHLPRTACLRAFAQGMLCLQQVSHLQQFVIVDAVTHAAVDALFDVTTQAAQHLR
jgi:hypothetical protein